MNQPENVKSAPRPKRSRRGLIWAFLLLGFFAVGIFMLAGLAFLFVLVQPGNTVSVGSGSVLHLQVQGDLPEYKPPNPFEAFFDQRTLNFRDVLEAVKKAGKDRRIEGIYLETGSSSLGWAQLQELRGQLAAFRDAGKWIVAYGELWQEQEYYLASVADEVYMAPEAVILLDGLVFRGTYYADALEKLGVRVHVNAIGEYKSYADSYRYGEMSEPHREAMAHLLNRFENAFIETVSASRELEPVAVRQALDRAVHDPVTAKDRGFLDDLRYPDQVKEHIANKLDLAGPEAVRLLPAAQYAPTAPTEPGFGDTVAVIYGVGGIQSGFGQSGFFGDPVLAADRFIKDLESVRRNKRVKAIVLRIDSPGGTTLASDRLWREIHRTADSDVPVIASLGNAAASGGYYMAMACDEIVAQPLTVTGSIGIVNMRIDFEGFYEKFNITPRVVKTAPSADFFDDHRGLTESESQAYYQRTRHSYETFVRKGAEARGLSFETFEQSARGRPWTGLDARERRLVDHLGGLDRAIELAVEKAKLDDYRLLVYPAEEDPWNFLRAPKYPGFSHRLDHSVARLVPRPVRLLWDLVQNQGGLGVVNLAVPLFTFEIE